VHFTLRALKYFQFQDLTDGRFTNRVTKYVEICGNDILMDASQDR